MDQAGLPVSQLTQSLSHPRCQLNPKRNPGPPTVDDGQSESRRQSLKGRQAQRLSVYPGPSPSSAAREAEAGPEHAKARDYHGLTQPINFPLAPLHKTVANSYPNG